MTAVLIVNFLEVMPSFVSDFMAPAAYFKPTVVLPLAPFFTEKCKVNITPVDVSF